MGERATDLACKTKENGKVYSKIKTHKHCIDEDLTLMLFKESKYKPLIFY